MARTHMLDRWLYRGRRAHWLARRINGATARVAAAGRGPAQLYTIEVRGRRSGKVIRFPLVVAEYEGERYLVSMLGETNWVRNVRAADGRAFLSRGRREAVRLDEVYSGERGAILRCDLACSPGRASLTSTSRRLRLSRTSTSSRRSTRSSGLAPSRKSPPDETSSDRL